MEGGVLRTVVLLAFLLGIGGLAVLFNPGQGHALSGDDFNTGRIIDDDVFTNKKSMSPQEIQNFLVSKNSTCLKDFKTLTLHDSNGDGNADEPYGKGSGNKALASKVIWQSAQIYDLNPQVLLVTLQKEQGLITRGDCPDWRYKTALGYGCPDNQPCDESAYGLTRQLDYGSWHFRGFYNDSMSFVPYTPGNASIQYHPDSGCGSSQVNIRNRATAALYSYTPYQPNKAALNNLDGLGNSCSAYGNRNFWRDFTRWFGNPTPGSQVLLLKEEGGSKIYLIRGSKRIHIATLDTYKAWGFDKLPVIKVSSNTINSYTPSKYKLRRFGLLAGTDKRFFVDGQDGYRMTQKSAAVWEFKMDKMPAVPKEAIKYLGKRQKLPYLVSSPVSNKVYMMDGGTLRHYPSPRVLSAWEPSTRSANISERFFCKGSTSGDSCDIRWEVGSRLNYPKARDPETGMIFFISGGNKHWLSPAMDPVYAGGHTNVSQATLNRFFDAPHATALLSRTYDHRKYLINGSSRHHIGNPQLFRHWKPSGNGKVTNVSKAFLDILDAGKSIDRFTANDGNATYYINQKKYGLNGMEAAYQSAGDPIKLTPATAKLYVGDKLDTPFVTSSNTSKIFFLGSRNKHHVSSIFDLRNMRGDTAHEIMNLPHSLLKNIGSGPHSSYQFTDGEHDYVFDNGSYRQVASNEWNLEPKLKLSSGSLGWFEEIATPLGSDSKVGNKYGVVHDGTLFAGKNPRLGKLWGADDSSPAISTQLASRFEQKSMSPFVTSPDSPRIYIYTGNGFSYISRPSVLYNLGYRHFNGTMVLPEDYIKQNKTDRNAAYLLSKEDGVMDNGERRLFADGAADSWIAAGEVNSLAGDGESQALIDLLKQNTNDTPVSRRITSANTSKHYCMMDGEKRWLTSPSAVSESECSDEPLRGISHRLLRQIPTGKNIY